MDPVTCGWNTFNGEVMKTFKVLFVGLLALSLTACQLFKPKDKPIDISKEMPKVSDVIKSVQAAIDQSSGHQAWLPSSPFTQAKLDCKTKKAGQKQKAEAECAKERALATKECNGYSGVHATVLCADALHRAQARCDESKDDEPKVCAAVALLAPPRIVSATLQFSAVASKSAGGKIDFLLLSGEIGGTLGRRQSLDLVLVPAPVVREQLLSADPVLFGMIVNNDDVLRNFNIERADIAPNGAIEAQRAEYAAALSDLQSTLNPDQTQRMVILSSLGGQAIPSDNDPSKALYDALQVVLAAAVLDPDAPGSQLTLKSAKYVFGLEYKATGKGGFKWTLTPAKLSGEMGFGSERLTGNVLTIEVSR